MSRISSNEMKIIAHSLKTIARIIDEYQLENWGDIPDSTHITINARLRNILDKVHEILTMTIILDVENHQNQITQLQEVTEKMKSAIKTIESFQKVVAIATSAAALAISISTGNVGGISASVTDIIDIIDSE